MPNEVGCFDVRAEARTYLTSNGKGNGEGSSRFPEEMTERKARARAESSSLDAIAMEGIPRGLKPASSGEI
jgi:hypothetical protein